MYTPAKVLLLFKIFACHTNCVVACIYLAIYMTTPSKALLFVKSFDSHTGVLLLVFTLPSTCPPHRKSYYLSRFSPVTLVCCCLYLPCHLHVHPIQSPITCQDFRLSHRCVVALFTLPSTCPPHVCVQYI